MQGWEVARHAREIDPAIPIVYMTGAAAEQWASHGVPHSTLLNKPFAPAQLVTAISQLLNAGSSSAALAWCKQSVPASSRLVVTPRTTMRWGMPPPPKFGGLPATNIPEHSSQTRSSTLNFTADLLQRALAGNYGPATGEVSGKLERLRTWRKQYWR
jgi:hypothetical protein